MRAGRVPGDTLVIFEPVTGAEAKPASELDMWRSLRGDEVVAYQRRMSLGPAPIVTALLVGVQIRLWWVSLVPDLRQQLRESMVVSATSVFEAGEVWRLFSAGLLHQDYDHLIGNLVMLCLTGWYVERALGRANLMLVFSASVFVGYLMSIVGSPFSWSLGSSGGVFGLIAATVAAEFVRPGLVPRRGVPLFGILLAAYMGFMFNAGLVREGVDNFAHLGGMLAGGALGVLLQPDILEVRRGHNRRVGGVVVAVMALLSASFLAAGPYLEPLVDSDTVMSELNRKKGRTSSTPPSRRNDSLRWSVPGGWSPDVDVIRAPLFASQPLTAPAGAPARLGFGVRSNTRERLTSVEQLAATWMADLSADHPLAEISAPAPTRIGGATGLHVRATIPGTPALTVEWRGAVRGVWTLQETWQVETSREWRLNPLRDRMRATVSWEEPQELRDAKVELDQFPDSVRARSELARALARAGQLDESLAMHDALLSDGETSEARWVAMLDSIHVGLELVDEPELWWDRALAASPSPAVVTRIVGSLDASERTADALGLLELAWWRQPGDRLLARARRAAGLSNHLAPSGAPWRQGFHPSGEARATPLGYDGPITMAHAAQVARELTAEREATEARVITAIDAPGPSTVADLLYLRRGYVPVLDADLQAALVDEIARATTERPPRWMSDMLLDALRADDGAGATALAEVVRSAR